MNSNYKAVLLTILTLSVFTLTIVELMGISSNAIFNKYGSKPALAGGGKGGAEVFPDPNKERTDKAATMPKTTMEFAETKFDFGAVKEGEVVKHTFKLKNTGSNPLLIAKTDVSCGCTVTEFSKEPVAPGAVGELTVQFNTRGKSGMQKKNILVHSNAIPEAVSISIEANVK